MDFGAIFQKNRDISNDDESIKLKTIDHAIFPRLEWSDRYLDMML